MNEAPMGGRRIDVTGEATPLPYVQPDTAWLEALQQAVGGHIEVTGVVGRPDLCLVVDEDGLLKELDENPTASLFAGQRIVGPAVLLPRALL